MDEFLKDTLNPMSFTDCTGIERLFYLKRHYAEGINLYSLFAREILDSDEEGYYLQSSSSSSSEEARSKLVRGRVSSGGVVIDGIFISWTKFSAMMQSHEGWEFELDFGE